MKSKEAWYHFWMNSGANYLLLLYVLLDVKLSSSEYKDDIIYPKVKRLRQEVRWMSIDQKEYLVSFFIPVLD